jgi:hypothetical protein
MYLDAVSNKDVETKEQKFYTSEAAVPSHRNGGYSGGETDFSTVLVPLSFERG